MSEEYGSDDADQKLPAYSCLFSGLGNNRCQTVVQLFEWQIFLLGLRPAADPVSRCCLSWCLVCVYKFLLYSFLLVFVP